MSASTFGVRVTTRDGMTRDYPGSIFTKVDRDNTLRLAHKLEDGTFADTAIFSRMTWSYVETYANPTK